VQLIDVPIVARGLPREIRHRPNYEQFRPFHQLEWESTKFGSAKLEFVGKLVELRQFLGRDRRLGF
jgi:hypothetical protein